MKFLPKVFLGTFAVAFVVGLASMPPAQAAGPSAVDLGTAASFTILAKSGISTTGTTAITGNIGVSPIAATALTGFALIMDSSNTFATSARVTGKAYAADYTAPTPDNLTIAVSNMEAAYSNAANRTLPTDTELGAGNIGGKTIAPGLYKWSTNVTIPTNVTLAGGANDVWIFQIAQKLTTSSATRVILSGGAQVTNIFWQVGGETTLGTNSTFSGNILGQTAIVLQTGATLNGRALAQTAVTLDANVVTSATAAAVPASNTNASTNTNSAVNTNTAVATNTNATPAATTANTNAVANANVSADATAAPSLPNSGLSPKANSGLFWLIIPLGILLILYAFYRIGKKGAA